MVVRVRRHPRRDGAGAVVTTYRTGRSWGVTIVREGHGEANPSNCGLVDDELVGMVGNGQFLTGDPHMAARVHALLRHGPDYRQDTDRELAERVCALLSAHDRQADIERLASAGGARRSTP